MWSLRLDGEGLQDAKPYYLSVGEHLVGRKDCQIQIKGDQSVSRKHAWITVVQSGTNLAEISLKDVSKFGCLVNGVKCQNSVAVTLKHDDKITFGTQNSSFRLQNEPLVVFASCLDNSKKKTLKSQLSKLGGFMVNEWQKSCSHLVMDALSFTVKVIYALVTCCPIVTPGFFDDLVQAVTANTELPSPDKYMPAIKEDLIDPSVVSFHPNEARKHVFAGKLFLFLEKKQHKRMEQAIVLAGGKVLLKETGNTCGSDDDMLTDENTLVMSVDSKSGIPEAKEIWIGHVGDILKSVNRRPIAETEVGLAILHLSLDEYCNTSVHHVPRITKQIVSKSISTMEEMSQRMNTSQNVTVNQVPEKNPFSLKDGHPKPNSPVTTPLDTKKRSRNQSDDCEVLVLETPQPGDVEPKRRRISSMDEFKTPGFAHDSSSNQEQYRRSRKEISPITDITHVSQSENYQLDDQNSVVVLESCFAGQKRKASSPSNNVTHVSQSQEGEKSRAISVSETSECKVGSNANITHVSQSPESQLQEKAKGVLVSSSNGKKLRFTCSKVNITHVSQSQELQPEEKAKDVSVISPIGEKLRRLNANITHVSQSQESERENETISASLSSPGAKKLRLSRANVSQTAKSEDEIIAISDGQTSPIDLRVKETPSPEISFTSKRRKISSSDLTHVSDSERSMIPEPKQRCLNVVSSPPSGQVNLDEPVSTSIEDKPLTGVDQSAPLWSRKSFRESSSEGIEDLTRIKSSGVSPPSSGWMSKKSFSIKKEQSDLNPNENRTSSDGVIEDLGEPSLRKSIHHGNSLQDSQGFSSKQERQTVAEDILVKKEENSEIPSDLMCVEHIELVVNKSVHPKTQQLQKKKKFNTTLKDMKRFRKQIYVGNENRLPRIIGGSDLVVFSSRSDIIQDWMAEVEAMNQQDAEDREADNLFRYEPTNKRSRNRR